MLFEHTTFIGIDPTAGKRPMAYAALDRDLRPVSLGSGDMEEVAAFTAGQESAVVAICGPLRPNQGLMKLGEVRAALNPVPRPGRWGGFRVAEYLLYKHKIRTPRTRSRAEDCPAWMQTSFKLYERLTRLGYQPYPNPEAPLQVLEVYPYASYAVLLECLPFPKTSLEGRLQRQLKLYAQGLEIPDPMRFFEEITRYRIMQGILPLEGLYSSHELDALVAAYTAWTANMHPERITLLGEPEEGQIVLPVKVLKSVYR
ncbi:MAG: DUF429 domain-containing protein [Anaerolineales bacterium]|nr:DUF429 domain-containing protein [Anaerolineales bacterium]